MNVVLRHVGQLVVDDVRQLFDIESARRDFRSDQSNDLVVLEVGQRPYAGTLTLVAVNGGRADAAAFQLLREAVRAVLGAGEHQHLVPVPLFDQMRQQMPLVLLGDFVHRLVDTVGRRVARGNLDRHRIAQEAVRELPNLFGIRRGEHQILPLRRQQFQDLADRANEAHVQHAIGFVQHEDANAAQIQDALLGKIQQPAGCGDQQIAAAAQGIDLRVDADTAEHHDRAQTHVLPVVDRALGDLGSQLPGRSQNQRAWQAALGAAELLQDRQYESGGFAGAGLGLCEDVAALENGGNGTGLNRSRGCVALVGDSTQQLGNQPEIIK